MNNSWWNLSIPQVTISEFDPLIITVCTMDVYNDVVKLVKQALGKENIFGYRTTLANQFCLLQLMSFSQICITDKLHWKTRCIWICWLIAAILTATFVVILYLLYGRQTGDIALMIFSLFAFVVNTIEIVIIPAIAIIWRRNETESMPSILDEVLMKNTKIAKNSTTRIDLKKLIVNCALAFWLPMVSYGFTTMLSFALFYEESNVRNYAYYMVPLPGLVERYGTSQFYVIANTLIDVIGTALFFQFFCSFLYPMIWAALCHNQAQFIIEELNSLSTDASAADESNVLNESKFRETITKTIHAVNDLKRMIESFRVDYEIISGIRLVFFLYVEIAHALLIMSPRFPLIVKIKEVSVFCPTVLQIFAACWTGSTLDELASSLSFAVYSTPWYKSTKVRQDVYILLCQTQVSTDLMALKVYPLSLATFLRFLNVIKSTVNIIQSVSEK